jgi:hypothetical protein
LWVPVYEGYTLKNKPEFAPCAAVRRGDQPNELRLVVVGARAVFYVNGENVAERGDISQGAGGFGVFGTSTSAASDVHFDNFELHEVPK